MAVAVIDGADATGENFTALPAGHRHRRAGTLPDPAVSPGVRNSGPRTLTRSALTSPR